MPRLTIQQFRAALAGLTEQGAFVRAYRALSRRQEVAAGMPFSEWLTWPPAIAPAAKS